MNVDFNNHHADAVKMFLHSIGFSPDRVDAINITDGCIEVALTPLPHGNPALASKTVITIDYTKENSREN